MATNKLQWKRIAMGDKLPCQSFLRKKDGEILKLSTIGGVTVGQDCYYLPVDEVINVIKDYPVEVNEDEEIRKELLLDIPKVFPHDKAFRYIAYLEKQGERKHQYKSRPRYVGEGKLLGKKDVDDAYLKGICDAKKELEQQGEQKDILEDATLDNNEDGLIADTIKSKGKQKPWSEDDENLLKLSLENLTELKDRFGEEYGKVGDCIVWLEALKDRVGCEANCTTTKAWSEEDEKCIDELIKFFDSMKDCLAVEERHQENRRWLKFLKSLKGTNIMQLLQEWSIEDNIRLQEAIRIVQNYHNNIKDEHLFATSGWCLGWLKSLRPQSTWKPSDEQMEALNYVINIMASSESPKENDYYYNVFKDLREQLKKIREE